MYYNINKQMIDEEEMEKKKERRIIQTKTKSKQ